MANTAHSVLTGTDLHENKGAAAATNDFVATVTTGATVWKKLTAVNLTGTGNPFGAQLLHVRDEKTAGTDGGTFTSAAWRTRTLNTVKTNEISGVSLSSNQIVAVPAGTYMVQASAPAYKVTGHVAKLRDVTNSTNLIIGTAEFAPDGSDNTGYSRSVVNGRFTLASTATLELQHECNATASTTGFGAAVNVGVVEVYAEVMIWRIA